MLELSIMIAMIVALALGSPAPGDGNLRGNADGVSRASHAQTQKGINPVQHSE